MENASKALIIAGAILISILIIGLGVAIYNMASNTVKRTNLNSQEAEAHNQQFTAYFGNRQSSTDVKNLMSLVRSNNITGETNGETSYITVVYGTSISNPSTVSSSVKSGKTYTIKTDNDNASKTDVKYTAESDGKEAYYSSGYLRVITITENTNS